MRTFAQILLFALSSTAAIAARPSGITCRDDHKKVVFRTEIDIDGARALTSTPILTLEGTGYPLQVAQYKLGYILPVELYLLAKNDAASPLEWVSLEGQFPEAYFPSSGPATIMYNFKNSPTKTIKADCTLWINQEP